MIAHPRLAWRFGAENGPGLPPPAASGTWLSRDERSQLATLAVEKRRRDWLLGRLNAKALVTELVAAHTGITLEPCHIEIAQHPSGAPFARLARDAPGAGPYAPGAELPILVSNSHSAGHALCAAAWIGDGAGPALGLGADLERVEPRSAGFARDFLTRAERDYCEQVDGAARAFRTTLIWSAKEAVLKALRRGLTLDTAWFTCLPEKGEADRVPLDEVWQRLVIGPFDDRFDAGGQSFTGFWRTFGGFVAAIAVCR